MTTAKASIEPKKPTVSRVLVGRDIDATATSGWNTGDGFIPIGALDTDYYSIGHTGGF